MNYLTALLPYLKKYRIAIIIAAIAFLALDIMLETGAHKHPKSKAVFVEAAQATVQNMPIEITAPGLVESQQSVAITPQITGTITKIAFNAGDTVKAGQLLFEIDPAVYSTSVQQAQAVLQRDQALYISERADADRYAALVKQEYVTQQQYDDEKAAADAQAAVVLADQAALQQAKIQLGYTEIVAPVSGKTGNVNLRVGDLVTANTATAMVTINQLNTVWVNFNIPQAALPGLLHYQTQSKTPLPVTIYTEDGHKQLSSGQLVFINNTVNLKTGTVLLKAEFNNDKEQLWPGLAVTVKVVLAQQPNAVTVPMQAIQNDQQGNFVYVIKQGKAESQRVVVARQVGPLAVIKQGLIGNEQVLTVVPPDITDGTEVRVMKQN